MAGARRVGGVEVSYAEAATLALGAGCDMVLLCNQSIGGGAAVDALLDDLLDAAARGQLAARPRQRSAPPRPAAADRRRSPGTSSCTRPLTSARSSACPEAPWRRRRSPEEPSSRRRDWRQVPGVCVSKGKRTCDRSFFVSTRTSGPCIDRFDCSDLARRRGLGAGAAAIASCAALIFSAVGVDPLQAGRLRRRRRASRAAARSLPAARVPGRRGRRGADARRRRRWRRRSTCRCVGAAAARPLSGASSTGSATTSSRRHLAALLVRADAAACASRASADRRRQLVARFRRGAGRRSRSRRPAIPRLHDRGRGRRVGAPVARPSPRASLGSRRLRRRGRGRSVVRRRARKIARSAIGGASRGVVAPSSPCRSPRAWHRRPPDRGRWHRCCPRRRDRGRGRHGGCGGDPCVRLRARHRLRRPARWAWCRRTAADGRLFARQAAPRSPLPYRPRGARCDRRGAPHRARRSPRASWRSACAAAALAAAAACFARLTRLAGFARLATLRARSRPSLVAFVRRASGRPPRSPRRPSTLRLGRRRFGRTLAAVARSPRPRPPRRRVRRARSDRHARSPRSLRSPASARRARTRRQGARQRLQRRRGLPRLGARRCSSPRRRSHRRPGAGGRAAAATGSAAAGVHGPRRRRPAAARLGHRLRRRRLRQDALDDRLLLRLGLLAPRDADFLFVLVDHRVAGLQVLEARIVVAQPLEAVIRRLERSCSAPAAR